MALAMIGPIPDTLFSRRQASSAARHFSVSDSCATKLMQRKQRFGSLAPARQGRPLGRGKLAPSEALLILVLDALKGVMLSHRIKRDTNLL